MLPSDHESKVVRFHLQNRNHKPTCNAPMDIENSPTDNQLFNAIKQGNAEALGTLYDRYVAKVYRITKRLIQNEQTIQEVIQDVFTRIWTTQSFDSNLGEFGHWITVVTRRIAIDYMRKHRITASPLPKDHLSAVDDNTERVANNRILRNDLLNAMSSLDSDQQIVLQLAYFRGYTLTEISSILGIPLGTVKSKLHKGLKKMRIALKDWTEEVQQ